ncbi:MAG: hypothetical protein IJ106_04045 [Parasporobacterium sp.]|nr:hypothetical protein [Parasporobacterium sp.]
MKRSGRSNALLVELLIVVMFFMLAATFLMQMFSAARMQGEQAEVLNQALVEAQNIAERLYAAREPEQALKEMGFAPEDGVWHRKDADLLSEVKLSEEEMAAGRMHRQSVRIFRNGELLIELPVAKYEEAALDGRNVAPSAEQPALPEETSAGQSEAPNEEVHE